jgi:hypothetical protein
MNIDPCESSILISNDNGSLSSVSIEPWGEEVTLQKGDQLRIVGRGPKEVGVMKLRYEGSALLVEGWPGSTLSFTLNGEVLVTASKVISCL